MSFNTGTGVANIVEKDDWVALLMTVMLIGTSNAFVRLYCIFEETDATTTFKRVYTVAMKH